MKTIFNKSIFNNKDLLLFIILLGLSMILLSCKKESVEIHESTGGGRSGTNPNASKNIDSTDILSFKLRMNNSFSDSYHSYLEIGLYAYNAEDENLMKKAEDYLEGFKELGYILWLDVSAGYSNNIWSHSEMITPVDKYFSVEFAKLIKKSGVMDINGSFDITQGLPGDVDEFLLTANYETGDFLDIYINSYTPEKGIDLYRCLCPLLIQTMLEKGDDYIALVNIDPSMSIPGKLIDTIHKSVINSEIYLNYDFKLKVHEGQAYLTGNYSKDSNDYSCENAKISKENFERLLDAFSGEQYFFREDEVVDKESCDRHSDQKQDIKESSNEEVPNKEIFTYTVSFRGIDKVFYPEIIDFDDTKKDLTSVFFNLVEKYSD